MKHRTYDLLANSDMPTLGKALNIPGVGCLLGWGIALPTDEGWATSAQFHHYDGTTNSTIIYQNIGDSTTPSWTSMYTAGAALTLDGAFDNGAIINGAISEATAFIVGGATDYFSFWQEGANDIRIGTSAGANITIVPAGGTVNITGALSVSGAISFSALTVTGAITASGGIAGDGWAIADTTGAISITGTGGITVVSGSLTLTAGNATLTAGNLTIGTSNYAYVANIAAAASNNVNLAIDAAGSGTIVLGGTSTGAITLTRNTSLSGTLAITGATTATGAIYANGGVDRSTAATLSIGVTNANAITISKSGVTTTVAGALTVSEATILTGDVTIGSTKVSITAASGNMTTLGTFTVGENAAGADVKFYDETTGDYILYDVSGHVLQFEDVSAQLMDDTTLLFGDSSDWSVKNVSASSNALNIDPAADDQVMNIGSVKRTDFILHGGTAGYDFTWDASANAALLAQGASLKIGGTAARASTAGDSFISIFNGIAAPAGTLANGITLYSEAGELKVLDAAGNSTTLSPHDHSPDWVFMSENRETGKGIKIKMEAFMKFLEKYHGTNFVEEYKVA